MTQSIVKTTLGEILFKVDAMEGNLPDAKICTATVVPDIPSHLEAPRCTAILLKIFSLTPIKNLTFSFSWIKCDSEGYGCGGEGLEAWEWEKNNKLVMIGTEDDEALKARISPAAKLGKYPIKRDGNSIQIKVEHYPEKNELTLHYIIAESNSSKENNTSCWFAVDIKNSKVMELIGNT